MTDLTHSVLSKFNMVCYIESLMRERIEGNCFFILKKISQENWRGL